MKFKIKRNTLLDGLQSVQNIVGGQKPTIPVLANVLMEADDSGLTLTTSDMDITIRSTLEAEVLSGGKSTLPVRRFSGIIREISDGDLEIEIDDQNAAHLNSGAHRSKLKGLPAEDFPLPPTSEGGMSYRIDKALFVEMLRKTHYAAATEESRSHLMGVLLSFSDGKLACVATDGRRLALMEREVEFPPENNKEAILPSRVVNELLRNLSGDGELSICLKDTQVIFEFDKTVMTCKLLAGVYPNFRQVIISQCDYRIPIPREELLAVLRRVTLFTSEKSNAIRFIFEDNVLTIIANSPDVGEAHDEIAVKYSGPKLSAIFNPSFVSDPLRALTSDEVYFELNDAMGPGLIKSDIPFLYVLMPLRV